MNWDDFDAFCQVVDHGGFSAAARALDRPKSSLSASVSRLETELGTHLLERTTRQLRLTDAGESLYRDISKPFAQLREGAVDALAKGATVLRAKNHRALGDDTASLAGRTRELTARGDG